MVASSLTKKALTVYRLHNPLEGTLIRCKKIPDSDLESQLQEFIERHLEELFGLKLVKSQFRLESGKKSPRPDTLAFDEVNNCFVVIEYKRNERSDGPVQLLTYAHAKTNTGYQRRMLEEYNKNPDLEKLTKGVVWENFYCVYIAFNVSKELISRMQLVNVDIRFYELQMYESIVVLHRVGITESSKDDGLNEDLDMATEPLSTPPGPEPIPNNTKPILSLEVASHASLTPDTLLYPDGEIDDGLGNWRTVMRSVSHWLFDNNHIKDAATGKPLCPHIPRQPNGRPYSHEPLSDKLFVYLHCGNKDMLSYIQKLLKDINYKPYEFKIAFK